MVWTPTGGTPQGTVISPLLANAYLDPLDHRIARRFEMVRYAVMRSVKGRGMRCGVGCLLVDGSAYVGDHLLAIVDDLGELERVVTEGVAQAEDHAEVFDGEVGVELQGDADIGVAEELGNGFDVGSSFDGEGGVGVPKEVRGEVGGERGPAHPTTAATCRLPLPAP